MDVWDARCFTDAGKSNFQQQIIKWNRYRGASSFDPCDGE